MTLNLDFLADVPAGPARRAPAVNVFEILRDSWRETRVDMTLQFFLDPNERHGLGTLVVDALLDTLDGAPLVRPAGLSGQRLQASDYHGSTAWEIGTQVNFIDVYATNRDLDIAIVLENKIGHVLDNPLRVYAERAYAEGFADVVVAVLAPEHREHVRRGEENWLSRSVTYTELVSTIKQSPGLVDFLLSPRDVDQSRSLDILQQFMEARSGGPDMTDRGDETRLLTEWRQLSRENEALIRAFFERRKQVSRLLKARARRLEDLLAGRLADAGYAIGWQSHSAGNDEVWNAYHFLDVDWSIELKFSSDPSQPLVFVFDYEGRTYRDARVTELDVDWTASDIEISDAFLLVVQDIVSTCRPGAMPQAQ